MIYCMQEQNQYLNVTNYIKKRMYKRYTNLHNYLDDWINEIEY